MQGIDATLFELVNAGPSVPAWSLQFASFASDFLPSLLALALAIGALFDRRWRHAFITAMISLLAVWLLVQAIRWAFPMPRPAYYDLGIQWVPQGIRPGFPSLHAAGTFTAAFSLWCLPWRFPMLAALTVAATVAWSRLYLGLHFPSDVVAAAMLGALVSILVERGIRLIPRIRTSPASAGAPRARLRSRIRRA
ncbi:phosphatase PAP2 family protein [Variovorax sp.]|uniref:phosphatase PAP2 family protein n=1 Tax=Variovorax sp. TaxID=1871043 RepID=UPI003BAAE058